MKFLRIFLGLTASGFCLWLVFRNIHWTNLLQGFKKAEWVWFIPMTVVYVFGHVLRSLRWSLLLSPMKKISSFVIFPILMFGFLMNNILPARAGEVARAYVASQRMQIPTSTVLGSIAMERLSDLIGLGVVMLIALTVLPVDKLPIPQVACLLMVGVVLVGSLLAIGRKIHRKGTYSQEKVIGKILAFLEHLIQGFASLKSPITVLLIALFSISIWMIEAASLMIGSRAFGLNLQFTQANALLSGISFGVMIPAAPGYIGTYEFFGKEMLKFLGFLPDVSLSFLLSFHIYQMLICSLLGIPVLLKFGLSPKS